MAKIKLKDSRVGQFGGFSPFGNATALAYSIATNAIGAAIGSDTNTAIASGDVIDLGELPEGMRLDDAQVFITTAMTADVTGSLGFAYSDGVDHETVKQDAAYFLDAGALSTAARLRATGSKILTLPKPARLILTTGGAANAKASDITIVVSGELTGPR